MLEGTASEQSSRMTAMENASNNAGERDSVCVCVCVCLCVRREDMRKCFPHFFQANSNSHNGHTLPYICVCSISFYVSFIPSLTAFRWHDRLTASDFQPHAPGRYYSWTDWDYLGCCCPWLNRWCGVVCIYRCVRKKIKLSSNVLKNLCCACIIGKC